MLLAFFQTELQILGYYQRVYFESIDKYIHLNSHCRYKGKLVFRHRTDAIVWIAVFNMMIWYDIQICYTRMVDITIESEAIQ